MTVVVKDRQFKLKDKYAGLRSEYIIKRSFVSFKHMHEDLTRISGKVSKRLLPVIPPSPFDRSLYKKKDPVRTRIFLRFLNETLEIIMQNDVLRLTDAFRSFIHPSPSYSRKKT